MDGNMTEFGVNLEDSLNAETQESVKPLRKTHIL